MKDERAGDIDPLRAVVDLVETTPEKADVVRRAVPGVNGFTLQRKLVAGLFTYNVRLQ
jgi:hypothetical protein